MNVFSQDFDFSCASEAQMDNIQKVLDDEIFTESFRTQAKYFLQLISRETEEVFELLYANTYLYDLFSDEQVEQLIDAPIKQTIAPAETLSPYQYTIELIAGEENEYSFLFRCDGEEYIGYDIAPGLYSILWCCNDKEAMISVYNGVASDGMEVSPDDYPVNVCTRLKQQFELHPGQYITLSEGSSCVLRKLASKTDES